MKYETIYTTGRENIMGRDPYIFEGGIIIPDEDSSLISLIRAD